MKKIKVTYLGGGKRFITECEDCINTLEIFVGSGQVIIDINMEERSIWKRIRHSLGYIFKPELYQGGGTLWIAPKRWKKLIKLLNE